MARAINNAQLSVGQSRPGTQWAMAHPGVETLTVLMQPPPGKITKRQVEMLISLAQGKTARQIAREKRITQRTVYLHLAELKQAFHAKTKAELIRKAAAMGYIEP